MTTKAEKQWAYKAAATFYHTLRRIGLQESFVEQATEGYAVWASDTADYFIDDDPATKGTHDANTTHGVYKKFPKGTVFSSTGTQLGAPYFRMCSLIADEFYYFHEWLLDVRFDLPLPHDLRIEHTQIIAKTGHGKTQLFQSLLIDDLEDDAAIVVIDSQRDLINTLAPRVDPERLILVDPQTCPPALNIFARGADDEESISDALGMYEYIFSALEAKLTSKQSLVYRMLARLCLAIPGANLGTLMELLEPGGVEPYSDVISTLPPSAQTFFAEYAQRKSNQYNETRQEVLRRVITVLERETFAKMLNAKENRLNVRDALSQGKILLISTNKSLLKDAARLFGRIYLAEVMQAVMSRTTDRKRVYVYVDEFKDYAEDSDMMLDLFKQSRKYNCAMMVAHQELADLPPGMTSAIAANTSIKLVGRVSAPDRNVLANEMRTKPEVIDAVKKGQYTLFLDGQGVFPYQVDFGRLEAMPIRRELHTIQAEMRKRYGPSQPAASTEAPSHDKHDALLPAPLKNDDDDVW